MNFNNMMNYRVKFSILLIILGVILVLLPSMKKSINELNPNELLSKFMDNSYSISVDRLARYIVNEDTTIQIIDLRSSEDYKAFNIPGSINIPYTSLLNENWEGYINQNEKKNVFYANGDILSANAWCLTSRLGYKNNYIMAGGLNNWYKTVMESKFTGKRISPKESVLFEIRFKARKLFTQFNSLPDSLKVQFLEAKRMEEEQLNGGCN